MSTTSACRCATTCAPARAWMRDPDANNAEAVDDGSGWVLSVEPGRPERGLYR